MFRVCVSSAAEGTIGQCKPSGESIGPRATRLSRRRRRPAACDFVDQERSTARAERTRTAT